MEDAVPTPGMEHIVHNGLNQIGKRLQGFKAWHKRALACARYFTSRYYKKLVLTQFEAVAGSERLRAQINACSCEPLEHRFAAIMEWILEFLPMRKELPVMVTFHVKRSWHDLEEENRDDFVDVQLVRDAVNDEYFWVYTVLVSCTGGLLYDLSLFSRGCACHKAEDIDMACLDTYAARAKAAMQESGGVGMCVGRGQRATDFACNKGELLLKRRFHEFKVELLIQCVSLSKKRRDEVMADLDSACQLVLYRWWA